MESGAETSTETAPPDYCHPSLFLAVTIPESLPASRREKIRNRTENPAPVLQHFPTSTLSLMHAIWISDIFSSSVTGSLPVISLDPVQKQPLHRIKITMMASSISIKIVSTTGSMAFVRSAERGRCGNDAKRIMAICAAKRSRKSRRHRSITAGERPPPSLIFFSAPEMSIRRAGVKI